MQLVERHVIKPNHGFCREADRLSWLYKNLYNCANYIYIYRQNFFGNKQTLWLFIRRSKLVQIAKHCRQMYQKAPSVYSSKHGLEIV